jgi:UDP-N-acetylglucosamine 1-carboxyvinyltransferase
VIEGVKKLHGCEYTIIPDRLVAGTFLLGAAITQGDVTVTGVDPNMLGSMNDVLASTGAQVEAKGVNLRVRGVPSWNPADITTAPYPGFPTDLQPPLVAYLSLAKGSSNVE